MAAEFETFACFRARAGAVAVEDRYPTLASLGARAVAQSLGPSRAFYVFPDAAALRDAVAAAAPGEPMRELAEVVFGDQAQKLRFDLDGLARADEAAARRELEEAVHTAFLETYGDFAAGRGLAPLFVWTESHGPAKRSWHAIVYNLAFPSAGEVAGFAGRALQRLDLNGPAAAAADRGIYRHGGGLATFRALGCAKPGEPGRAKRVCAPAALARAPFADQWARASLAQCEGLPLVPVRFPVGARPARPAGAIPAGVGPALVQAFPDAFAGLRVRSVVPCVAQQPQVADFPAEFVHRLHAAPAAIVQFDRAAPGQCLVCRRQHQSDTPFAIVRACREGAYWAVFRCWRNPAAPALPLGEFAGPGGAEPDAGPRWARLLAARAAAHQAACEAAGRPRRTRGAVSGAERAALQAQGLEWLQYCEPRLRPLTAPLQREFADPDAGPTRCPRTVFVLAGLMMGKTQTLLEHLRQHYPLPPPGAAAPPRILIVSCRRTFTRDLLRRFEAEGFASYEDQPGPLRAPRLIVQVESLGRLAPADPPDLLVVDEASSVLLQLCSPHVRAAQHVISLFESLLRFSRRVVLMDAQMTEQVFEPVRRARGFDGALLHENLWSREGELGKRIEFTGDAADWTAALRASCLAGRRVAVFTNSRGAALKHRQLLADWGVEPARLLEGQMPEAEKLAFFADVNAAVLGLRALVATPVITVGVSIDAEHFDEVYGDFSGGSCAAEACMQMLGRVRRPRAGRLVVLARPSHAGAADSDGRLCRPPLPVTLAAALAAAERLAFDTLRDASPYEPLAFAFLSEVDRLGYTRLAPFRAFPPAVWAGNTALHNASAVDFVGRLLGLLVDSGAEVVPLAAATAEERAAALLAANAARDVAALSAAEALAAAEDVHDAAAQDLRSRHDLDAGEVLLLRRAQLRQRYALAPGDFAAQLAAWPGGPAAAVRTLSSPRLQKFYTNAVLLLAHEREVGGAARLVQANARFFCGARRSLEAGDAGAELALLLQCADASDAALLCALETFARCCGFPALLYTLPLLVRDVVASLLFFPWGADAAFRLAQKLGLRRSADGCAALVAALRDPAARQDALQQLLIILNAGARAALGLTIRAWPPHAEWVGVHFAPTKLAGNLAFPSRLPDAAPQGRIPVAGRARLYPRTGRDVLLPAPADPDAGPAAVAAAGPLAGPD